MMARRFSSVCLLALCSTLLTPDARGNNIEFDNETLNAGNIRTEIHPIKGSGGVVELQELTLTQSAGAREIAIDLLFFQVPAACAAHAGTNSLTASSQAVQDCNLQNSGLGTALADGSLALCCTAEMVAANQCTQVNRAIASQYFTGVHRYLGLSPNTPLTFGVYSEVQVDGDRVGDYALVLLNCDESGTATLNGKVIWESFPGGYEIWQNAELALASDFEQMARFCGIDVNFFVDGGPGTDDMAFIKPIEDYLARLAVACTDDEVVAFNQAFEDFHDCAGFDLQLFIEDLPSGLLGTAIECIATMDWKQFEDMDWMDLDQVASIQLSEACLEFEFGANALGFGLRQMALHPDKTMACFKTLSPKVPTCQLPIHPIPIVGGLLKPAACLVGEMPKILDDVLKVEMGAWDKCLPADPQAAKCQNDCLFQGSILMRGGNTALPVSDAMKRLAAGNGGGLQSALDRYQKHLHECTDEWSGWENFDGATQADRHKATSTVIAADSSSNGGRGGGLYEVALLLVGLFCGVVLAIAYERMQRKKAFKQTEKQLELTERDYADDEGPSNDII